MFEKNYIVWKVTEPEPEPELLSKLFEKNYIVWKAEKTEGANIRFGKV